MRVAPATSEPTVHQATILCIDDEQTALEVRTQLLASEGYRVFSATSANAAMGFFVAHEIDLVLSDHMLRGLSGAELSIFMKQVRPGVAVVLLSGSARLPATLLMHVDACVQKGGPTQELLDCLRDVLAKRAGKTAKSA
jgi:DNA-binding NtrC family response regulator